jgi:hypothetical protein
MTNRYLLDLAERVIATYVEAFLGLVIASGFGVNGVVNLSLLQVAAVSALPAALAVVKAGLAKLKGDPATASLVDVAPPAPPIEDSHAFAAAHPFPAPEPPIAVVVSVTHQGETVDAQALRTAIRTAMPKSNSERVDRVLRFVVDELAQQLVAVA